MSDVHENPPAAIDTAAVRARMLRNKATLQGPGGVVGRDQEIDSLFLAPLCSHHALLVGKPGTGKSFLSRCVLAQFNGSTKYWEGLFTRQTVEDQILGHLDIPAFQAGRMEYIMDGHAPEAHFAFCDEPFKATGGLLNGCLSWLNERKLMRGTTRYSSPLVTAIGASNEFGEDESTEALEDRFLFRHWVDYISERKAKLEFIKAKRERRPVPQLEAISLDELRACQADAQALPVDDAVDSILADLQETLATTGVTVSDRRLGQCLDVMRAQAWLSGDPEVGPEHVDVLAHVLWRRPEDIPAVQAAIGAVDKGVLGHLRSATEEALREYYALRADCDAAGNWRSEQSREKYKARCLDLMNHIQAKASELFQQYNRKLPARIKERAQAYFTELNAAFEQCRDDARL